MLNKAQRAKLAKETINTFVPKLLKHNPRAQTGVNNSQLIHHAPKKLQTTSPPNTLSNESDTSLLQTFRVDSPIHSRLPRIRILKSDTFAAVASITTRSPSARVCALNMASALNPGGGVLHGAMAQEEALCMRSTLYASLKEEYYRVPDDAAIYSPDVLAFRGEDLVELPKAEWFFTDVISCAALRQPDLVEVKTEGAGKGMMVYAEEQDREMMIVKIRLIFQIAKEKGVTHLVLGALGCGAYRNPPEQVAGLFRAVMLGGKRKEGVLEGSGLEEVVFAIFDEAANLRAFKKVFGDVLEE